jgi:putative phage-type endonuclease
MEAVQIKPGTPEWLEARRSKFCASDAPRALGFSRFGTGVDVCLEKWGQAKDEETPQMRRGLALEPAVARAYELRFGVHLEPEQFVIHPKIDWMAATPDRLVPGGKNKHLQIKTHVDWLSDEYGEDGTDDAPDAELVQVAHELAVVDGDEADLAVLLGSEEVFDALVYMMAGNGHMLDTIAQYMLKHMDFRIFPVTRNIEFEKELIEAEKHFWESYVIPHVLPPSVEVLKTLKDTGVIRLATEEEALLIAVHKENWINHARAKMRLENTQEKLKLAIDKHKGIDAGNGLKVTWGKNKDTLSMVTNWPRLAEEQNIPQDIIDQYTEEKVVRKESRTFRVPDKQWKKLL